MKQFVRPYMCNKIQLVCSGTSSKVTKNLYFGCSTLYFGCRLINELKEALCVFINVACSVKVFPQV